MTKQKKGNLYLIPTTIAENSLHKVITDNLKLVIVNTKYFMVENVRTARRFISSLKLNIRIEHLEFEVLDKNTKLQDVEKYCSPLLEGQDMGVLSEAGCPGIADPGNLAVAFAHHKKIKVIPLVGPSSILLALMASGFNGQTFVFHGYLPIDKNLRNKALASIERDAINKGQTQIFMETPYRNNQLLKEILRVCKPETKLCIARNITGENELIESKSVGEWRKNKLDLHKQPTIFLLSA